MGISFRIRDKSSGVALSGVIVWLEYGSRSIIPFTGGVIEVHSVGAFTGAHKAYEVWVDGYVPRFDDFIQNNGLTQDILLSRYASYIVPEEPIPPPEVPSPPSSPLGWLTLLGLGALLIR